MRPRDLIVEPVLSAEQPTALRADADADGRGIASRFVQEWQSGAYDHGSRPPPTELDGALLPKQA